MEALKAELALKRKSLATEGDRPNKYMRRGDIEKMRLEQERKEAEEKAKARQQEKSSSSTLAGTKVCSYFSVFDTVRVDLMNSRTGSCKAEIFITNAFYRCSCKGRIQHQSPSRRDNSAA